MESSQILPEESMFFNNTNLRLQFEHNTKPTDIIQKSWSNINNMNISDNSNSNFNLNDNDNNNPNENDDDDDVDIDNDIDDDNDVDNDVDYDNKNNILVPNTNNNHNNHNDVNSRKNPVVLEIDDTAENTNNDKNHDNNENSYCHEIINLTANENDIENQEEKETNPMIIDITNEDSASENVDIISVTNPMQTTTSIQNDNSLISSSFLNFQENKTEEQYSRQSLFDTNFRNHRNRILPDYILSHSLSHVQNNNNDDNNISSHSNDNNNNNDHRGHFSLLNQNHNALTNPNETRRLSFKCAASKKREILQHLLSTIDPNSTSQTSPQDFHSSQTTSNQIPLNIYHTVSHNTINANTDNANIDNMNLITTPSHTHSHNHTHLHNHSHSHNHLESRRHIPQINRNHSYRHHHNCRNCYRCHHRFHYHSNSRLNSIRRHRCNHNDDENDNNDDDNNEYKNERRHSHNRPSRFSLQEIGISFLTPRLSHEIFNNNDGNNNVRSNDNIDEDNNHRNHDLHTVLENNTTHYNYNDNHHNFHHSTTNYYDTDILQYFEQYSRDNRRQRFHMNRRCPFLLSTSRISINTLPIRKIEKKDILLLSEARSTCSICQYKFKPGDLIKTLPCFHFFHVEEIEQWLQYSRICPICRHPIDEIDVKH